MERRPSTTSRCWPTRWLDWSPRLRVFSQRAAAPPSTLAIAFTAEFASRTLSHHPMALRREPDGAWRFELVPTEAEHKILRECEGPLGYGE